MLTTANYKKLLLIIRCLVIAFFVLVLIWLIRRDLVLSGQFDVSHNYQTVSPFFTELVPKQRVALEGDSSKFLQEPVYSTLRYPRPFQELTLSMVFKNPDDLFVEFGPQTGLPEVYTLHGVNHPMLNKLLANEDEWGHIENRLYQKNLVDYRYASVEQFKDALPDQQSVGYYGVDWETPYLPAFFPQEEAVITTPLRGGHDFYAATNKGTYIIELDVQDINSSRGPDPITVTIESWEGEVLEQCELVDDGEDRERGVTSKKRAISCEAATISGPSILLIRIEATQDIIIHEIRTSSAYFVAKDAVQLAGGPDYRSEFGDDALGSTELFTSSRQWTVLTPHRSTLQSIRLARETVELEEPYETYTYQMPKDQRFLLEDGYSFITEKGNLQIVGRGVYAFSQEHYFSPKPWLIDATTDPQVIGIQYLLTDYNPPVERGNGVLEQTIDVDLSEVFAPEKNLRVQWSLPDKEDHESFYLLGLDASYSSEPVTFSNAKEKLLRFIEREF